MRNTFLAIAVTALAGCSATGGSNYGNTTSWLTPDNPSRYGYRDYDPCIRCGEGWIFLNIDETADLKERTYAGQN